MRVVLDTNILLTSFSSRSQNHWVWVALAQARFTLCFTHDILLEYEEVISRHSGKELAQAVIDALLDLPNIDLVTRYYRWNAITTDPDDNKFVDCVVAAQAQYLVSEDRHFQVLGKLQFPIVEVISLEQFRLALEGS